MSTPDPALLATLTDEERAAFEPDDDVDVDALKAVAGEDADDDADDDEAEDGQDEAKAAAPIEGKGASDVEPEPEPEPEAQPEPQVKPVYEARLPDDYETQLQGIKDEDARLRQAFKDGEIDIDERDAGLAALSEKREALLVARTKAEIARDMNAQSAASTWQAKVNEFLATTARTTGIDYRKDQDLGAELDKAVKMLANDPANDTRSMDWFLEQAHKWVVFNRGLTEKVSKSTETRKADPKTEALSKRKPDTSKLPRNLADVPGGDGPGDVGGEFADIDSLDGEAYEAAIARMSPSQREKFLRGE